MSIQSFPQDFFFVLRTVQLLRGLKQKMGLPEEWSVAVRWESLADDAISRRGRPIAIPEKEVQSVKPGKEMKSVKQVKQVKQAKELKPAEFAEKKEREEPAGDPTGTPRQRKRFFCL